MSAPAPPPKTRGFFLLFLLFLLVLCALVPAASASLTIHPSDEPLPHWDAFNQPDYEVSEVPLTPVNFTNVCALQPPGPFPGQAVIVLWNQALASGCLSHSQITAVLEEAHAALVIIVWTSDFDAGDTNRMVYFTYPATFIPATAGAALFLQAHEDDLSVSAAHELSPYNIMTTSPLYKAFYGIEVVITFVILAYCCYSLAVFFKKNGFTANARSLVFFFGSLLCVTKIIQAVANVTSATTVNATALSVSFIMSYLCFMCFLNAWITVCGHILGDSRRLQAFWRWSLYVNYFLMGLFSLATIFLAVVQGIMRGDRFALMRIMVVLVYVILIPCLLLSSVFMVSAAARVLHVLNKTHKISPVSQGDLKIKIAITCIADSLLHLAYTILLAAYVNFVASTGGQVAQEIVREVLTYAVIIINIYSVAYQFSELRLSSKTKATKTSEPQSSPEPLKIPERDIEFDMRA